MKYFKTVNDFQIFQLSAFNGMTVIADIFLLNFLSDASRGNCQRKCLLLIRFSYINYKSIVLVPLYLNGWRGG